MTVSVIAEPEDMPVTIMLAAVFAIPNWNLEAASAPLETLHLRASVLTVPFVTVRELSNVNVWVVPVDSVDVAAACAGFTYI